MRKPEFQKVCDFPRAMTSLQDRARGFLFPDSRLIFIPSHLHAMDFNFFLLLAKV
jgi:hypothetical protein